MIGRICLVVAVCLSRSSHASVASPLETKKRLTLESMSPAMKKMQYAVRGHVVIEADKIADELRKGSKAYPFDHITYTNIGNPHSVGQKPLTWPRQVMALVDLPDEVGVNHPLAPEMFPEDAIRRAREIKEGLGGGGSGAYSHSKGARLFREDVATFLEKRDGVPADPSNIFLTNGASAGINMVLNALIANSNCGTMIPIPQYPIYSATLDLFTGHQVGYYLDEEKDWALNMQELERAYQEAVAAGINVNSFVLINPGNPTGQVLTRDNVHDVVRFCAQHNLVLLADEVYQENVYDGNSEFVSCKRAAFETGLLDDDAIELVSFHSVSKGVFGECGRRGGYMEFVGIDEAVRDEIYKLASSFLCSSVSGQIMTSLMVRGPVPGDESYESHEAEKRAVFDSLKRRAKIVSDGLNTIPGFSCRPAMGAMYCFPAVKMPRGALLAAQERGVTPDTLYAVSLLENTGICVVPASGFEQRAGRFGFRTTFLPPEQEMAKAVERIRQHYEAFCADHAS